jgi:hypothetical protein
MTLTLQTGSSVFPRFDCDNRLRSLGCQAEGGHSSRLASHLLLSKGNGKGHCGAVGFHDTPLSRLRPVSQAALTI